VASLIHSESGVCLVFGKSIHERADAPADPAPRGSACLCGAGFLLGLCRRAPPLDVSAKGLPDDRGDAAILAPRYGTHVVM
jgi:hypothetical protein